MSVPRLTQCVPFSCVESIQYIEHRYLQPRANISIGALWGGTEDLNEGLQQNWYDLVPQ